MGVSLLGTPQHINRRIMLIIALSGLVFYSPTRWGGSMQNPVLDLTIAMVEHQRLSINGYEANSRDVAFYQGNFYSGMAPGLSVLAIPAWLGSRLLWQVVPESVRVSYDRRARNLPAEPYAINSTPFAKEAIIAHMLMTFLYGSLAGALAYAIVFGMLCYLGHRESMACLGACAYSFATVMTFYNLGYYTQSVAVVCLLAALYFLWLRTPSPAGWCAGGLCCSLAGAVDYPFFVYGGLIAAACLVRAWRTSLPRRCQLALVLGALLPLGLTALYHKLCFGSFFTTAYSCRYYNQDLVDQGFAHSFIPRPGRLSALLISTQEGVLTLMPFLGLFPFGAWHILRRGAAGEAPASGRCCAEPFDRRLLVVLMLAIIAAAGFYFTCVAWLSDMAAYGPRFFLAAVPLLAILACPCDARLRAPYLALVVVSFIINHCRLIGLKLPPMLWALVHGKPLEPVHMYFYRPFTNFELSSGAGLLYAAVLLSAIVLLFFGVPALKKKYFPSGA